MAVFTGNGSAGSPSFTFSSDTDTGLFRKSSNIVGITAGGYEIVSVDARTTTTGLQAGNTGSYVRLFGQTELQGTAPSLIFYETDTVDNNPFLRSAAGSLVYDIRNDSGGLQTTPVTIDVGGAVLVGTTSVPDGATAGAIVAQDRVVISTVGSGYGRVHTISGEIPTVTATTGTAVFTLASRNPASTGQPAFVKLSVSQRALSNVATNHPVAEYWFQIFHGSTGACSIGSDTAIFEYQYVKASHFAFANLGSGECTITLTNPVGVDITGSYKIEFLSYSGNWTLDSVTTT